MSGGGAGPALLAAEAPPTFFLVGSERSGTTLLRLMLTHHPAIECAPEFEFLVDALPADGGWPDLEGYRESLATNRIFLPHGLTVDPTKDYPALVRGFVEEYCARSGKPVHGATCHKHFDRLPRIWPEARFVHLVRDGRDVARSCIAMGWAANVWFGADRWVEALETWERLRALVPPERRLETRYEDLVTDTEAELERIARFLGVEYDPAMLGYAQESTYDPPDPALIARWRRSATPEELALLEARIGPLLRAWGYEESGVEPARVGPAQLVRLRAANRRGLFRQNRERYGLGLMLQGRIARLLRWKGLQRRVALARNAIDNRHIR